MTKPSVQAVVFTVLVLGLMVVTVFAVRRHNWWRFAAPTGIVLLLPLIYLNLQGYSLGGNGRLVEGPVSTDPIGSTASGPRYCGLLSRADLATISGGARFRVRQAIVNQDPRDGSLLDVGCVLDSDRVYVSVTAAWSSIPSNRESLKRTLAAPTSGSDARYFPATLGVGYVVHTRDGAGKRQVSGQVVVGVYDVAITLIGVPDRRDDRADAIALVEQAVTSARLPSDPTAPRPTSAPRGR